jgi:hypothetical protein
LGTAIGCSHLSTITPSCERAEKRTSTSPGCTGSDTCDRGWPGAAAGSVNVLVAGVFAPARTTSSSSEATAGSVGGTAGSHPIVASVPPSGAFEKPTQACTVPRGSLRASVRIAPVTPGSFGFAAASAAASSSFRLGAQ